MSLRYAIWDMSHTHSSNRLVAAGRFCVCVCGGLGWSPPLQRHSTGFVLLCWPSWYRVRTDPSQTSLSSSYRWLTSGRPRRSAWALSAAGFPALEGECAEVLSEVMLQELIHSQLRLTVVSLSERLSHATPRRTALLLRMATSRSLEEERSAGWSLASVLAPPRGKDRVQSGQLFFLLPHKTGSLQTPGFFHVIFILFFY